MEYQNYIERNSDELVRLTNCNFTVLTMLKAIGAITEEDANVLLLPNQTPQSKNYQLWEYLKKKPNKNSEYIRIFSDSRVHQDDVANILDQAVGCNDKYNFTKNRDPLSVAVVKPREAIVHNDDTYKLHPYAMGLALVINITTFDKSEKNRNGAENDFEYMKQLWTQLGYQVTEHSGYIGLPKLKTIVKEFLLKFSFQPTQKSCVVYIGTHGTNGQLELSDGNVICAYKDFIFVFAQDMTLGTKNSDGLTKPKIFIMQSCQVITEQKERTLDLSCIMDAIVCYPTLPGDPAHRDTKLGSWFVYTLTDVFMREAHKTEIKEMLRIVQRKMLTEIQSEPQGVQISYFRDFELKPLYFNVPSEDE